MVKLTTRARALAAASVLAISVAACVNQAGQPVAQLATSSIGTSLLNAVLNMAMPSVNAAVAKGSAASAADLQVVAYWLPWAQKTIDYFGPSLGMPTKDVAAIDVAVPALVADFNNPASDVGTIIAQAKALFAQVNAALAPAAAAAKAAS